MHKTPALIVALMLPLLLGTTYIVRENDKEVGKWSENDGNDVTRYIDNATTKQEPQIALEPQKITPKRVDDDDKQRVIEENEKRWERQEDFGIREGITRAELESTTQKNGFRRKQKYSDGDMSTRKQYWIFEYEGKTKHYEHFFQVYLDANRWIVDRVIHTLEEK